MADPNYVYAQITLPLNERSMWRRIWDYVLRDVAFGAVGDRWPSENMRGKFYAATTSDTSDAEFSISHSLGREPRALIQAVPLNVVGAKTVRLRITRAADAERLYLASPEVSAPIYVYVE